MGICLNDKKSKQCKMIINWELLKTFLWSKCCEKHCPRTVFRNLSSYFHWYKFRMMHEEQVKKYNRQKKIWGIWGQASKKKETWKGIKSWRHSETLWKAKQGISSIESPMEQIYTAKSSSPAFMDKRQESGKKDAAIRLIGKTKAKEWF